MVRTVVQRPFDATGGLGDRVALEYAGTVTIDGSESFEATWSFDVTRDGDRLDMTVDEVSDGGLAADGSTTQLNQLTIDADGPIVAINPFSPQFNPYGVNISELRAQPSVGDSWTYDTLDDSSGLIVECETTVSAVTTSELTLTSRCEGEPEEGVRYATRTVEDGADASSDQAPGSFVECAAPASIAAATLVLRSDGIVSSYQNRVEVPAVVCPDGARETFADAEYEDPRLDGYSYGITATLARVDAL